MPHTAYIVGGVIYNCRFDEHSSIIIFPLLLPILSCFFFLIKLSPKDFCIFSSQVRNNRLCIMGQKLFSDAVAKIRNNFYITKFS